MKPSLSNSASETAESSKEIEKEQTGSKQNEIVVDEEISQHVEKGKEDYLPNNSRLTAELSKRTEKEQTDGKQNEIVLDGEISQHEEEVKRDYIKDELEIEESMQSEEKDLKDELLKTEEESRTLV